MVAYLSIVGQYVCMAKLYMTNRQVKMSSLNNIYEQEHSESTNLRQRQSFKQKWFGIQICIAGLIQIRMSAGSVPKCCWMHYRYIVTVSVSNFAKYLRNRPLIVREILKNVRKSPIPQRWRKWKKWCGIRMQIQITTNIKLIKRVILASLPCQVWSTSISAFVSYCSENDRQNDSQNDHITSACCRR